LGKNWLPQMTHKHKDLVMECFSTEILSMHLDNALDDRMSRHIEVHLHTCQRCTDTLGTLEAHDAMLASVLLGPQMTDAPGRACYHAEELIAYASGLLTPQEAAHFEQHVRTCDVCLRELMLLRNMVRLQEESLLTPPADLVAAARQLIVASSSKPKSLVEKLGALIIQVTPHGLKFLEALALPTHVRLVVGGQLIPAGAFRGAPGDAGAAALLDIQQTAGELELRVQAFHEEKESVAFHLQLRKQGYPLAHTRVTLARGGRTLHSRLTSASGEVKFQRLVPGEYILRIPQEQIETQCLLRAAPEPG
jgi:anti-sigma factor RsiW